MALRFDRMRGLASAALVVAAAALASFADDDRDIHSIAADPVPAEQRHGSLAIPSGVVKYAAWYDLRVEITHDRDPARLEVFAVGDDPVLPPQTKDDKGPVWLTDKRAAEERKSWRQVSGPNCLAMSLFKGADVPGRPLVMLGVEASADKKGGVALYWRHGPAPKAAFPLYEPCSLRDAAIIVRQWGKDLKPRVIAFLAARKEETALVLRKGKRIVAVVRYQPAVPGGDPFARLVIAVDVDAKQVEGTVEFVEEKSTKALLKFAADHETKSWEPSNTGLVVSLDGRQFLVRMQDEPGAGTTYQVYEKPAP